LLCVVANCTNASPGAMTQHNAANRYACSSKAGATRSTTMQQQYCTVLQCLQQSACMAGVLHHTRSQCNMAGGLASLSTCCAQLWPQAEAWELHHVGSHLIQSVTACNHAATAALLEATLSINTYAVHYQRSQALSRSVTTVSNHSCAMLLPG
jgi:hypothetical protein